jgi:peroxiredoxin Q/BCP
MMRQEAAMTVYRWMGLIAVVLVGSVLLCNSQSLALQVGEKAPDFALPATTAEEIKLADYLGKQPVVLFFYIGAFTGL